LSWDELTVPAGQDEAAAAQSGTKVSAPAAHLERPESAANCSLVFESPSDDRRSCAEKDFISKLSRDSSRPTQSRRSQFSAPQKQFSLPEARPLS
jgi:hypothetical protein